MSKTTAEIKITFSPDFSGKNKNFIIFVDLLHVQMSISCDLGQIKTRLNQIFLRKHILRSQIANFIIFVDLLYVSSMSISSDLGQLKSRFNQIFLGKHILKWTDKTKFSPDFCAKHKLYASRKDFLCDIIFLLLFAEN